MFWSVFCAAFMRNKRILIIISVSAVSRALPGLSQRCGVSVVNMSRLRFQLAAVKWSGSTLRSASVFLPHNAIYTTVCRRVYPSSWLLVWRLPSTYHTRRYKEIRVSPKSGHFSLEHVPNSGFRKISPQRVDSLTVQLADHTCDSRRVVAGCNRTLLRPISRSLTVVL